MLQFGRRSLALVAAATVASFVPAMAAAAPGDGGVAVKGGLPASRNARLGFSPRPAQRDVSVGNGGCGTPPAQLQNQSGAFCTNAGNARPLPMGSGLVVIDAAANSVNGTGTVSLNPVEPYTLQRITVTTTEPMLLVTAIQIGRTNMLESGQVAADLFQSGGCCCDMAAGANIWPSVGIQFTFANPSTTDAQVIVSLVGVPGACPN